ncbi:MAG: TrkH family potassium uptake protein [Bacillota bacterium]
MFSNTVLLRYKKRYFQFKPAQIVVFGFFCMILMGTFLLTLPAASKDGHSLRFIDALFTATSAVCVTGLVVVDTGMQYSLLGQIVVIMLIQIGGLGWMSMATLIAFAFGKRITLRERLLIQESYNQYSLRGLVRLARRIIFFTVVFELSGGLIMAARLSGMVPFGKALYYGIWHSVSAFCNSGFDLFGEVFGKKFVSLINFAEDPVMSLTIAGLIIFGGLGFPVLAEIFQRRTVEPGRQRFSLHSKVVIATTILLLAAGTILIIFFEYHNTLDTLSWSGKLLGGFFQSVTPRTAGFNTLPIGGMREVTLFLLIVLMFIGASPSSTGGGIKTSTFAVLMLTVRSVIKGRQEPQVFGRRIKMDLVAKALTVAVLSLLLVILVTAFLSTHEPDHFAARGMKFGFINLLFEVTSAFGTVGLSTGVTPFLSTPGKLAIILTMFAGRVGPLSLVVALAQQEETVRAQFPQAKVMIG